MARAAKGLSIAVHVTKKPVYTKFNHNLCYGVSIGYSPSQLKLQEKAESMQLESTYMKGMR